MSAPPRRKCAVCDVKCNFGCSRCKVTYYCSAKHQENHWMKHKNDCLPIYLEMDKQTQEEFFVADKSIGKGQAIFTNRPFMVFPLVPIQLPEEKMEMRYHTKVCMGCCQEIPVASVEIDKGLKIVTKPPECSLCHWPVCNDDCAKRPLHSRLECNILAQWEPKEAAKENKLVDDTETPYNMSYILRTLLMKDAYPERWEMFMEMSSQSIQNEAKKQRLKYAISFIREECKQSQFQEKFIEKVFWILEKNVKMDSRLMFCGKLEVMSSYVNQSCLFNVVSFHCTTAVDPEASVLERVERQYFALSDIAKGEKLNLPIAALRDIFGTVIRRNVLQQSKGILCSCKLCSDPTEFKTYISAVRCYLNCKPRSYAKCKTNSGYLLPIDPLDPESSWKCNKCSKIMNTDIMQAIAAKSENKITVANRCNEDKIIHILTVVCKATDSVLMDQGVMTKESLSLIEEDVTSIIKKILPTFETFLYKFEEFLHWNHYTLVQGRMFYLELLFLYLSLNRYEEFVPDVVWIQGHSFKLDPKYKFSVSVPLRWIELNEELRDKSTELLKLFQKIYPDQSILPGKLFVYLSFSKWMILKHAALQYNDFEKFKTDVKEWSYFKHKADDCFRNKNDFNQISGVTASYVDILKKMDSVDPVKKKSYSVFSKLVS